MPETAPPESARLDEGADEPAALPPLPEVVMLETLTETPSRARAAAYD